MASLDLLKAFGSGGLAVAPTTMGTPEKQKQRAIELYKQPTDSGGSTLAATDVAIGGGGGGGGMNTNQLMGTFDKYAAESEARAKADAEARERAEIELAERGYEDAMGGLRGQREEINTLAGQQKSDIAKQVSEGKASLGEKRQSEEANIGKQKNQFETETIETQDQLARNWRDMAMKAQSIMRARGASEGSFAAGKEMDLLSDFNDGLNKIAQYSQTAAKEFADALVETTNYYTRAEKQLEDKAFEAERGIDNWVRQNIATIQNMENTTRTQKLAQIKEATLTANEKKSQIAQSISDQRLGLATWAAQAQASLAQAAATAGQGKLQSGMDQLKAIAQQRQLMSDMLLSGEATFQDAGNGQLAVRGYNPFTGADDVYGYMPASAGSAYANQIGANLAKGNPQYTGQAGVNQGYSQLGLQAPAAPAGGGGLLSTIGSWFR